MIKLRANHLEMQDGTLLYYEKSGAGDPLFLLHGNGGDGRYFSEQVAVFAQRFTVYAIDSRNHGQSTNTQDFLDFPLMAGDLSELMQAEELKKVNLLGFSDGANLALVFTVLYPEKVQALVLNSGNTQVSGIKAWANVFSLCQVLFYRMLAIFQKKYQVKLRVARLMTGAIGVSERQLRQIVCPVLVIVGRHDVVKLRHSKYLARHIPRASFLRMPSGNHFYARTNPQSFNQAVFAFFDKK
ncbi:alpha/beta fold hydrolase [Enterococcus sp. LJL98]